MKLKNNIGWCDDTGNMVVGCTPVSPECARCYAELDTSARVLRAGGWPGMDGRKVETWGALGERVPVLSLEQKARRYNKLLICDRCRETVPRGLNGDIREGTFCACGQGGGVLRRIRLFADSNSDWLDKKWTVSRLADLLRLMHECPNVDFILFTKRIEDFRRQMCGVLLAVTQEPALWEYCSDWLRGVRVPPNVWLGVSVGVRSSLPRIELLRQTPAAVRVVSFEPLLEDVFGRATSGEETAEGAKEISLHGIDWAIFGGESGPVNSPDPRKRPRRCDARWILNGVRHAHAHGPGLAIYVKQMGSFCTDRNDAGFEGEGDEGKEWPMGTDTEDCIEPETEYQGKPVRVLLKHPDGADPAEWPEHYRRREWPRTKH